MCWAGTPVLPCRLKVHTNMIPPMNAFFSRHHCHCTTVFLKGYLKFRRYFVMYWLLTGKEMIGGKSSWLNR